MKHLQIRLEDDEYTALKQRAFETFGEDNLQRAGREAIKAWCNAPVHPATSPRVLRVAILYLDWMESNISHGKAAEVPAKLAYIARAFRDVFSPAEGDDSATERGTGRPRPAGWRKLGPHGKNPGPTKTDS